ncbi:MAG: ceramide glucosyltransferase [Bauldia sp.]
MTLIFAGLFVAVATTIHVASLAIAAGRFRRSAGPMPPPHPAPMISILRPVRGLETDLEETLLSGFQLSYPDYEIVFCCADANDPVIPLVERLIAAHPGVRARLLVGDDRVSINPKLNNLVKGWDAAAADWIVMIDSNVLLPRDTLERLMNRWRNDTGLVTSPAYAVRPKSFWAEVEAAFLNTFHARMMLAADSLGLGFAQGKILFWRRADLERNGGIRRLAGEVAEDAAGTKMVRQSGLRVRLAEQPFAHPLGRRAFSEIWLRQLRWARLRREAFAGVFSVEVLFGGVLPALALTPIILANGISLMWPAVYLVAWYGAEIMMAAYAGWPVSWRIPAALLVRDIIIPPLWVAAWLGKEFNWRGNAMAIGGKRDAPPEQIPTLDTPQRK